MNILMVGAEANPYVKVGGLGDVVYSLSKALVQQGEKVAIVLPYYLSVKEKQHSKVTHVGEVYVHLSWRMHTAQLYQSQLDGITYYWVDLPYYFERSNIYGYHDEHERWAAFVHAIHWMLPVVGFQPDIIHVHDWPAGMLPVVIKTMDGRNAFYKNIKYVLTIHSPAFHGEFPPNLVEDFYNLPMSLYDEGPLRFRDQASTLKAAIHYVDHITTVSPTHAKELLTYEGSFGLNDILYPLQHKLIGILNGIDTDEWDPLKDPHIPYPIHEKTISEDKQKNKEALFNQLGLEHQEFPLFGLVSRLTFQKGIGLILDNLNHFVHLGAKFVILGSGEGELEHRLREYAYKYPKAVKFIQGYNNPLAHQIYASSDFFLMPSLFEPCGIAQMIAMRYGTLPIVRETGGLIDTVKGYAHYQEKATGFSFQHYTGDSLGWAMNQAIEIYSIKDKLYQLQQNAYHQQNDWKKASGLYLKIYKSHA